MCKPKKHTPMNCDVFCSEDVTREQFEDINITGNLFLSESIPFRASNISIEENFNAIKSVVVAHKVTVRGNLDFNKDCYFRFYSLDINGSCIIGKSISKQSKKTVPVNCDVFTVNGFVPDNICITGNLYIKDAEFVSGSGNFDVGEDIFIKSSRIKTNSIKSQGRVHVYGKKEKGFGFILLAALGGCKVYSNTTQSKKQ